ncbi:MAG: hypothetical protein HY717_21615 [Planctomycetes bacterium]|nr:hypothetical protein [Planctomycetota bacterium]
MTAVFQSRLQVLIEGNPVEGLPLEGRLAPDALLKPLIRREEGRFDVAMVEQPV